MLQRSLQRDQQKGRAENHNRFGAVADGSAPHVTRFKQQVQRQPREDSPCNSQQNRRRHPHKPRRRALALRHPEEGAEQHNHKHVVERSPRQNKLWDPLADAAPLLHQPHHPGHDHRRGNRPQHRAHDGRLQPADAENHRRQQHKSGDLEGGRQERHQQGRTAHLLQIRGAKRKPRLDQDDDKSHLPQIGRNAEN